MTASAHLPRPISFMNSWLSQNRYSSSMTPSGIARRSVANRQRERSSRKTMAPVHRQRDLNHTEAGGGDRQLEGAGAGPPRCRRRLWALRRGRRRGGSRGFGRLDTSLPALGQDEDDFSGPHEVQRLAGGLLDGLRVALERRDLGFELPVVLVQLRDLGLHLRELDTLPPDLKKPVLVHEKESEDERREKKRDRDVGRRPHVRRVRARAGWRRRRFGHELGQRARLLSPRRRAQPPHAHDPGRTLTADDSFEPHGTFSRETRARVSLSSR